MNANEVGGRLAQLIDMVEGSGARVEYDSVAKVLTFSGWDRDELEPVIRLHVDDEALRHLLADLGDAATSLWPDVDSETAALRLLSIHIEETVLTRKPGENELVLDAAQSASLAWIG